MQRIPLQWIPEQKEDGQWTLQSVRHHKYLGIESTPKNGTPLYALDEPQLWDIEILPESEDHDNPRVKYVLADHHVRRRSFLTFCVSLSDRLWIRGTLLVAEFPSEKSDRAPLQLWESADGENQVWVLEEYESRFEGVW